MGADKIADSLDVRKHKLSSLQRRIGRLLITETLKILQSIWHENKKNAVHIVGSLRNLEPCFVYEELPTGEVQVVDVISDVDVLISANFLTLIRYRKRLSEKTLICRLLGSVFRDGYVNFRISVGVMPLTLMRVLRLNTIYIYEAQGTERLIDHYDILNLVINDTYELINILRSNVKYRTVIAIRRMAKALYGYMLSLDMKPASTEQMLEFLYLIADSNKGHEFFKTKEFAIVARGAISTSQLRSLEMSRTLESDINCCLRDFIIGKVLADLLRRRNKGPLLMLRLIFLETLRKAALKKPNLLQSICAILRYGLTIDDIMKLKTIVGDR